MKSAISSGFVRGGANVNPDWLPKYWEGLMKGDPTWDLAGPPQEPYEPLEPNPPIEVRASPAAPADMGLGATKDERLMFRQQGYTGDQCSKCSSMRMKVTGHCMVCEDCGETTGCN